MKIVILGGYGRLGSAIARGSYNENNQITIVDNLVSSERLRFLPYPVEFIHHDLTRDSVIPLKESSYDLIINCAMDLTYDGFRSNPVDTVFNNYNILRTAVRTAGQYHAHLLTIFPGFNPTMYDQEYHYLYSDDLRNYIQHVFDYVGLINTMTPGYGIKFTNLFTPIIVGYYEDEHEMIHIPSEYGRRSDVIAKLIYSPILRSKILVESDRDTTSISFISMTDLVRIISYHIVVSSVFINSNNFYVPYQSLSVDELKSLIDRWHIDLESVSLKYETYPNPSYDKSLVSFDYDLSENVVDSISDELSNFKN